MTKPLTKREIDIARLYLDGMPPKEIATKLHLSRNTVQVHWHHIKLKSGAKNAVQFALSAMGRALTPQPTTTTPTP